MPTSSIADLLRSSPEPELQARRGLALLEFDFRTRVLLALADWEQQELVHPELYRAVAALQGPASGHWNGPLTSLRDTSRAILRGDSSAERERLQRATWATALLEWLEQLADRTLADSLRPLADLVKITLANRPRLGALLALPLSLRNLVAHFAPADPE
jgi:hypothetical protein